jgi:hypothetical protein
MNLTERQFAVVWADGGSRRPSRVSRRGFIAGAAGVASAAATAKLWFPIVARAEGDEDHGSTVAPRPIPQTVAPGAPFHLVLPGSGAEPSSITDFHGTIGVAALGGTGVGIDAHEKRESLLHDVDVRFFKGKYVGVDNKRHQATFVFV